MGKQTRVIAHNAKDKQQQQTKKPKAVKTNLKRLNERVRNKVEQIDKLFDKNQDKAKKQEPKETPKQTKEPAAATSVSK